MTCRLHPAHADDREPSATRDLTYLSESYSPDGGPRNATGSTAEPGAAATSRMQRHSLDGVDERQGVGAGRLGGLGDRAYIGRVRGQLHDQGLAREGPDVLHEPC